MTDTASDPVLQTTIATRDGELGLVTKRTYLLAQEERCRLSPEQRGLNLKPVSDGQLLLADTDGYVFKPAADLVIKGSAHAPGAQPVEQLDAGVDVAGRSVRLRVTGQRRVRLRQDTPSFSRPEPFHSVELSYREAYGGVDVWAKPNVDALTIGPIQPYTQHSLEAASLAGYRRNLAGKGYLLALSSKVEGMELPRVEAPDDLLTPERLVARSPLEWYRQPLPAGLDWFNYSWFPRMAFLASGPGLLFGQPPPDDPPLREVLLGQVPADIFKPRGPVEMVSERIMNGASPPLIFDRLGGAEELTLHNMDPAAPRFDFQLPGEVPALTIKPFGEAPSEAQPFLATVLVDKEAGVVEMVWTGRVKCKYPHGQEHLEKVETSVRW